MHIGTPYPSRAKKRGRRVGSNGLWDANGLYGAGGHLMGARSKVMLSGWTVTVPLRSVGRALCNVHLTRFARLVVGHGIVCRDDPGLCLAP